MSEPTYQIQVVDNVFVRLIHFVNSGDVMAGHRHTFDHITLLSAGRVKMECDGGEYDFEAPHLIVTTKGKLHKFTALSDNTVLSCIHAIRDGDGVNDVAAPNVTPEQQSDLLIKYPLTQE